MVFLHRLPLFPISAKILSIGSISESGGGREGYSSGKCLLTFREIRSHATGFCEVSAYSERNEKMPMENPIGIMVIEVSTYQPCCRHGYRSNYLLTLK